MSGGSLSCHGLVTMHSLFISPFGDADPRRKKLNNKRYVLASHTVTRDHTSILCIRAPLWLGCLPTIAWSLERCRKGWLAYIGAVLQPGLGLIANNILPISSSDVFLRLLPVAVHGRTATTYPRIFPLQKEKLAKKNIKTGL